MVDGPYDLTPQEKELLDRWFDFYRSLATGTQEPVTDAQKHFVVTTRGGAVSKTPHETAYNKWRRNQAAIEIAERNEAITERAIPEREEGHPGQGFFTREDAKKLHADRKFKLRFPWVR